MDGELDLGQPGNTAERQLSVGDTSLSLVSFPDELRQGAEDVTGFELWQPATLAACRRLDSEASPRCTSTLDLGCGLGSLGIFCAKRGAAHVVLADKERAVLGLARRNAEANGEAGRCDFVLADFTCRQPPFRAGAFDLLVASDVLFLDSLARPLLGTLEALVSPSATAVLGHEVRRAVYRGSDGEPCVEAEDSALSRFVAEARSCGRFAVQMHEGASREDDATEVVSLLLHARQPCLPGRSDRPDSSAESCSIVEQPSKQRRVGAAA